MSKSNNLGNKPIQPRNYFIFRVKCYFSALLQEGLPTEKKKENACPKCKTKKCIYQEPENGDAPGASPRHYGTPIAIVL